MRNMSFSLTTPQIRARSKTVTRRMGWGFLKPGDRLCAIVKGQGLKKGEKVERLCIIEVVSNRSEPLCQLTNVPLYGVSELFREGFPNMMPHEFVDMFCKANACKAWHTVNRIEFKYV